jgi:flagellar basal body-associated protein FliL
MAEETQEQEGTMSGLKKTLIGAVGTIVTAGGVWAASLLGGGDKAEPAPVQAAPVINITNSQTQQQAAGGNKTIIINKGVDGKPAQPIAKPKKKEGDEFKEEAPKW